MCVRDVRARARAGVCVCMPELLDAAEAAHDRDVQPMWDDPDYVSLIASPVFEEIAKRAWSRSTSSVC